ncbi:MAG: hypothetical protein R3275_00755 [Saprospiraceae bacterium]|nr:hypothetical protein [Saprospiraceae bacterium]
MIKFGAGEAAFITVIIDPLQYFISALEVFQLSFSDHGFFTRIEPSGIEIGPWATPFG